MLNETKHPGKCKSLLVRAAAAGLAGDNDSIACQHAPANSSVKIRAIRG
jgi:hypothetical protein